MRIQPFAHIMAGGAHSDLQPDSITNAGLALVASAFNTSDSAFALFGGGGVDYVWKDYIAFRATGDYVRSYLFKANQNNFRVSVGVNFRIGRK